MTVPVNYQVDRGSFYMDIKTKSAFRRPKVIMTSNEFIQAGFDLSVNVVSQCAPPELGLVLSVSSNISPARHTLTSLTGHSGSDGAITISWDRVVDFMITTVPNYANAEADAAGIFGGDVANWKFNGVEFFYETDTHVAARVPMPSVAGSSKYPKYTGSASLYSYDPVTCVLTQSLTISSAAVLNPTYFDAPSIISTIITGGVDASSILETIDVPAAGVDASYAVGKAFLSDAAADYLLKTNTPYQVGF